MDLHRDLNLVHHLRSANLVPLCVIPLGLLGIDFPPPDYWMLGVLLLTHAIACSTFALFVAMLAMLALLVAAFWAQDRFEYTVVSLSKGGIWPRTFRYVTRIVRV